MLKIKKSFSKIFIAFFSLLAFFSGFIGLAYELIYVRAFGLINGDLYTTYAIIVLTFMAGISLGNLFGFKLRRFLPFLEIGGGFYACLFGLFLQNGGYNLNFPIIVLIILLLVPAFIVGLHVPLYAYYLKKISFDLVYALYHLGAVTSLLLLEVYVFAYWPLSWIFIFLGFIEILIGLIIWWWYCRDMFKIQKLNFKNVSLIGILKKNWSLFIGVFLMSLMSFYFHFSLLRIILYYQFLLRPTFSYFIIVSILFVALGAIFSSKVKLSLTQIIIFFFIHVVFIFINLPILAQWLIQLQYADFYFYQFCLDILAFSPLLWPTVFFCRSLEKASAKSSEIDIYSGLFLCVSSLGNIFGYVLVAILATLITKWLIIFPILLITITMLILLLNRQPYKLLIGLFFIVITTFYFYFEYDLNYLLTEGVSIKSCLTDDCEKFPRTKYTVDNLAANYNSLVAVLGIKKNENSVVYFTPKFYVLDGYLSHIINYYTENIVGFYARRYFDRPLSNSLVIGIGTGQTVSGVAMISDKTIAADINAAVFAYLPNLNQYNNNLLTNPNVSLIRDDGMNYLKKTDERFELILNTATNMFTHGVAKLHTKEFLNLVKKHLSSNGVYVSWLDSNSIHSKDDLDQVIALQSEFFKFVDAHYISDSYLLLVSYEEEHSIHELTKDDFSVADYEYLFDNYIKLPNYKYVRDLQNSLDNEQVFKLSTMDYPILEKIALNNYMRYSKNKTFNNLKKIIELEEIKNFEF